MIREIIRPTTTKVIINIPKEYVGKDVEVLLFTDSDIEKIKKTNNTKKLLKEFEEISKNISILEDKNIDITKIDEDMYSDIF